MKARSSLSLSLSLSLFRSSLSSDPLSLRILSLFRSSLSLSPDPPLSLSSDPLSLSRSSLSLQIPSLSLQILSLLLPTDFERLGQQHLLLCARLFFLKYVLYTFFPLCYTLTLVCFLSVFHFLC